MRRVLSGPGERGSLMSSVLLTLLAVAGAIILGVALAYVPLRLIVGTIAKNVKEFIERQRERRSAPRDTVDRRKEAERAPTQPS